MVIVSVDVVVVALRVEVVPEEDVVWLVAVCVEVSVPVVVDNSVAVADVAVDELAQTPQDFGQFFS